MGNVISAGVMFIIVIISCQGIIMNRQNPDAPKQDRVITCALTKKKKEKNHYVTFDENYEFMCTGSISKE